MVRETSEARNPTYEIKCKNGHLSWKHLTTLEFTIQTSAKDWNTALSDNSGTNLSEIISLPGARPVSIVSYHRRYYESANHRIRVTLDNEISYFDQNIYSGPNFLFSRRSPEKLVVEIKLAQEDLEMLETLKSSLVSSRKDFQNIANPFRTIFRNGNRQTCKFAHCNKQAILPET